MSNIQTPYFVSSHAENNPKSNDDNMKHKDKYEKTINTILQDNNQIRKKIPEGEIQIFKAISYALFFTTNFHSSVQNICNNYLLSLIRYNNLNEKLGIFKNNIRLYRNFCANPCQNQVFEKAILELVSNIFKVRIIIFIITEDCYLTSIIVNNGFEKTIQLFKHGSHFDVLYDKNRIEAITISQEIIQEEINKHFGKYHLSFENWIASNPEQQLADFLLNLAPASDIRLKSRHKKSLSDNFNISHEQMESDQKKYYEMFANLKEPEEFFTKISPSPNSRFANQFPKNEESNERKNIVLDYFSNNLALQNYNISPSNISSLNASFTKINIDEGNKNLKNTPKSIFFNDNDINNPENLPSRKAKSPIYYVGTTPPGLTPKKNIKEPMNKSNERLNEDIFDRSEDSKSEKKNEQFPKFLNYESEKLSHFQNKKGLILNINKKEDINDFRNISYPTQNRQQNFQEPKKPIIIDDTEPKVRKTGRLKFFDESKSYGFIVMDEDGSDIFVHLDDISRAGVTKDILRSAKHGNIVKFSFFCMNYIGKYNKSKKAVDLELL